MRTLEPHILKRQHQHHTILTTALFVVSNAAIPSSGLVGGQDASGARRWRCVNGMPPWFCLLLDVSVDTIYVRGETRT